MQFEVVIPNFNGSHLIKKNLPDVIAALAEYSYTITIVDDGSETEDYKRLESYIHSLDAKNISLIRNRKNKGFAYSINTAALVSTADFLILLNSDVVPKKNFLVSPLKSFEHDPNLYGVGCMDESIEHDKTVLRGRGVGKFTRGFLMHEKGDIDKSNTLWISGGSSIVRTHIFQKLRGMDELYSPFYWEDIDLSYRAIKSGYTILFDSNSVVEHRHEEGAIKSNFSAKFVKTIAYRNQIIFMWKNITDPVIWREHIFFLPYHLGRAVARGDIAFLHGFFRAVGKIPKIIATRRTQHTLFTRTDSEVIATV